MVYDTKNRLLIKENQEIKLSKLEHKLLIALADEKITLYEELSQFMYGCKYKLNYGAIPQIKKFLCKKTGLEIRAITNRGYILESNVLYK